jgi:predicted metal-dependent peptidase
MSTYDREARDLLESSISTLVLLYPLYGTVFLYLNKVERKDLPTMAVGTVRRVDLALYYNPDFVKKLSNVERRAVLKHEALHILLHHLSRTEYFAYNPRGYNISADLAINCHIEGLPNGALFPKAFNLENNQSAEWYYEKLKKEAGEDGEISIEGKGDLVDDHSMWGDCDDDIIKEKVRNIAEKAIKEQEKKGWGDISGDLAQKIIAANKPIVNWKKEVRYFINQIILMGRRNTRMRPNRRYGYNNPGTKRDYVSRILVGVDTSGSVSDEQLKYFLTEINGMISHVMVDLVQFDYNIHGKPESYEKKHKTIDIVGRGGTNFEPVIKLADEMNYDGLIIFTDGYAPFPPKPKSRVMWCVCKQDAGVDFPYGKKVVIENNNK